MRRDRTEGAVTATGATTTEPAPVPAPVGSPSPPTPRRLPSLDALTGLRFLAAGAVVVSHFAENSLVSIPAGVVGFLDGGRTAVSLFFVLSGFVLAYNYAELAGRDGRWNYYVARVARIYPVVLLGIAVGAVGMVYARAHPELLEPWFALKSPGVAAPAASVVAQLTMTTGWFPFASINQPWNGPAWSVSCEVFFYALFPVLIVAARRRSARTVVSLALAMWVSQGLLAAALIRFLPVSRSRFLIEQFPVTHLAEFLLGIAAWRLVRHRLEAGTPLGRGPRAGLLVGVLAGLAMLAWLVPTTPMTPASWPMVPLFAVLVAVLALGGPGRSWLALPAVVLLGEASYSLYLLHFPLIRAAQTVGVPTGVTGWALMAAVVAASVLVFRYYETPLRRRIRRRASR